MSVERDDIKFYCSDLEIGMFVTRLDRPWEETNFLLQGFLIESAEDIENIQQQCQYVYVERKTHLKIKGIRNNWLIFPICGAGPAMFWVN